MRPTAERIAQLRSWINDGRIFRGPYMGELLAEIDALRQERDQITIGRDDMRRIFLEAEARVRELEGDMERILVQPTLEGAQRVASRALAPTQRDP